MTAFIAAPQPTVARTFNGSTSTMPLNASFVVPTPATLSAWVNWAGPPTGENSAIIGSTTNGDIEVVIKTDGRVEIGKQFIAGLIQSDAIVATNVWTHIATAYDGTTAAAYVRGIVKVVSVSNTLTATGPYHIGQMNNGIGNLDRFMGSISDLAVWNEILSPELVFRLAQGARPDTLARTGTLTGYWPMTTATIERSLAKGYYEGIPTNTKTTAGPILKTRFMDMVVANAIQVPPPPTILFAQACL